MAKNYRDLKIFLGFLPLLKNDSGNGQINANRKVS